MAISASYIRKLEGDRECVEALAWLAERAPRYPAGGFTPPLKSAGRETESVRLIAVCFRIGRTSLLSGGARVNRVDWFDGASLGSIAGTNDEVASGLSSRLFTRATASQLIVTSGVRRHVLDVWLSSLGPSLLRLGYSLLPCCTSGNISWVRIRKGKRTWTVAYLETASGVSVQTCLDLVKTVAIQSSDGSARVRNLYAACRAYADWLLAEFGVRMRATAGMSAMRAARTHLSNDFWKWRPTPLLVAMERLGGGYRGGLAYATRYRGPTWRIDVNRQYTGTLASALPLSVAFGRADDGETPREGVFMCRVWLSDTVAYPLARWMGYTSGFERGIYGRGEYVCILHSSEFAGLRSSGATIRPSYGFVFTRTFSLSSLVAQIQGIIDTYGKGSARGKCTKPIGNYLYGKFGQRPDREELMYSADNPGKEWWPYIDSDGNDWDNVWTRKVVKHTASQHVDIAAAITGAARGQTIQTWASLSESGVTVVRCHTDSLTVDMDPCGYITTSNDQIGEWALERSDEDSIIVGPNAFFDGDTAHIAGVSNPTYEMIEMMADGQVVRVVQNVQAPRCGFQRGAVRVERKYGAR